MHKPKTMISIFLNDKQSVLVGWRYIHVYTYHTYIHTYIPTHARAANTELSMKYQYHNVKCHLMMLVVLACSRCICDLDHTNVYVEYPILLKPFIILIYCGIYYFLETSRDNKIGRLKLYAAQGGVISP